MSTSNPAETGPDTSALPSAATATPDSAKTDTSLQVHVELEHDAPPPRVATPAPRKHDPNRIRGQALRRGLFLTTFAWLFGAFWMFSTNGATATELANYFSANDRIFGLMAAVPFLSTLFQIPGSLYTQHLGRRKGVFLWGLTLQRVTYFGLAILPWVVPAQWQTGAWLMLLLLLIAGATGNFGGQAWVNWMADFVPERIRGKYFARRSRMGIVIAGLTGLTVGALMDAGKSHALDRWLEPVQRATGLPPLMVLISVIFFLAAIAGTIDIQCFRHVEEPPMRKPAHNGGVWEELMRPLRDREFRRFVTYLTFWTFSVAFVGTFAWKYLSTLMDGVSPDEHPWLVRNRFIVSYLVLTISVNAGQFMAYPLWGKMIDRFGRKPVIRLSSITHTATLIFWACMSPALLPWGILVQFCAGAFVSGLEIANFNMMLSYNRQGGPSYQSISAVVINSAGAISGILAGQLATGLELKFEHHGVLFTVGSHVVNRYHVLFALSVLLKCFADFVLLPRVHDTQSKGTRFAIRYVMANMYDNINTYMLAPMRQLTPNFNEGFKAWKWWRG